jgi:hypothetical protein
VGVAVLPVADSAIATEKPNPLIVSDDLGYGYLLLHLAANLDTAPRPHGGGSPGFGQSSSDSSLRQVVEAAFERLRLGSTTALLHDKMRAGRAGRPRAM